MNEARRHTVELAGRRLTTATWGDGPPELVVLHDGLGSIAQWRSVPAQLAAETGRTVMAYDRSGHGESTPVPTGAWPSAWLHEEARVLAALIEATGASNPALVGHSDGGSIAAIHAAITGATGPIVLLAAHSWLEAAAADEIARMRRRRDDVVERLARFHAHPGALFDAWSGVWTSDEFSTWDIRPLIGDIAAPTLVVQGERDEFATPEHVTETAAAIGAGASWRLLDGVGHLMHHQQPDRVVELVGGFLDDAPS